MYILQRFCNRVYNIYLHFVQYIHVHWYDMTTYKTVLKFKGYVKSVRDIVEVWRDVKERLPNIFQGQCIPTPTDYPLFRDGLRAVYGEEYKEEFNSCMVPLAGNRLELYKQKPNNNMQVNKKCCKLSHLIHDLIPFTANFHMGKSAHSGLFIHYYEVIVLPLYNFLHTNATPIRPNTRFGRQAYYLSILREAWLIVRKDLLETVYKEENRLVIIIDFCFTDCDHF